MDVAALREHVGPGPADDVLDGLLNAALEAIDARYGPVADKREYLRPFGQWVRLGRRAFVIVSVSEAGEVLEATDYAVWPGGHYLQRLDGTDPINWTGMVDVTYTPLSDMAERDRVAVALVDLDLNRSQGLAGITVGPWSEQYVQGDESYRKMRETILSSMQQPSVGVW